MRRAVLVLLAAILALALAGSVGAAPPDENPGNGPPDLTRVVFVHYPKGAMAKGGIPGPPGGGGGGGGGDKEGKLWYKYSGIHWDVPTVDYKVHVSIDAASVAIVDASFDTWEATGASIAFDNAGTFAGTGVPSAFIGSGVRNDDNEVAWISFDTHGLPSNAIGITSVLYYTLTGVIVEVDMALNDDLPWSPVGAGGAYDVQNIVTHEAGHWVMLGDLYNRPATEQTMYGYGAKGETRKQTLESGDIAGILAVYPAP